jgi:hypothetical protein
MWSKIDDWAMLAGEFQSERSLAATLAVCFVSWKVTYASEAVQ